MVERMGKKTMEWAGKVVEGRTLHGSNLPFGRLGRGEGQAI
jgi:hypothetical protein